MDINRFRCLLGALVWFAASIPGATSQTPFTLEAPEVPAAIESREVFTKAPSENVTTAPPTIEAVQGRISDSEIERFKTASECMSGRRHFNPDRHKKTYYFGIHSPGGIEVAVREHNLTFADYLTATAGQRFDPPIEFKYKATTTPIYSWVDIDDGMDFFYSDTGVYSCIGVERGAQPIATTVSELEVRNINYKLDMFAGVIFTRADNRDITHLEDLKDRTIGALEIGDFAGAQAQFYAMDVAGKSYIMDPKQVVFVGNQIEIVKGVYRGDWEVGFVRTGMIERTTDENGDLLDPDMFRVIDPQLYVMDDGYVFPFLHSTPVFPEWPVYAATDTPRDVIEEVQAALLALTQHKKVGTLIRQCEAENPDPEFCATAPIEYFDPDARCDTTRAIANLAYIAGHAGHHDGFRSPRSYFELRTMQEAAGFLRQDAEGSWHCTRAETLYDAILCPEDHYKVSPERFAGQCERSGVPCPVGDACYCKPCIKAYEVDVYEWGHDDDDDVEIHDLTSCSKMSLCASVPQTKTVKFRAYDNLERDFADVLVYMHIGQEMINLPVTPVNSTPPAYDFEFSYNLLAVGIMEIFINGEQIPESPIRVQITDRMCDDDFPGQNKVSDGNGECVCRNGTFAFNDTCVSTTIIAVFVSLAVIILIAQVMFIYVKVKHKKADEIWHIGVEELHFDDPVEIIGQGSFGQVLLAEYRGTKVAIKRAVRTKYTRGSTKTSRTKNGSRGSSVSRNESRNLSRNSSRNLSGNSDRNGSFLLLGKSTDDFSESTESVPRDIEGGRSRRDSMLSRRDSLLTAETTYRTHTGSTEDNSLGFLVRDFGGESKWAWLFPWRKRNDYQSRFREQILGNDSSAPMSVGLGGRLCPWFTEQGRRREEFMAEMRLVSKLRHPCITTVMGAVMSRGHEPMLVMEYMEYGSLYALLRNETMVLSGEMVLQITRDIAQGLRYLHSSKPPILHGDLKARNILIDARFRAKVCDFGLSTKSNNCLTGTPFWLAPEYLRGRTNYTPACDIYSIGIMLYEIYSRRNPFEGEDFKEVLRGICDPAKNRRPQIPKDCPPKMAELMKKCWSQDPFYRPNAMNLDMTLMDMQNSDAEPLVAEEILEKEKSTDMLYEIFPKYIANALKAGQKVDPEDHEMVTVVFSDIVRFTDISKELTPLKVSNMLDRLYQRFDRIARKHDVFKVETIGDAYMGVTNLEANQYDTHVKHIAEFAIDMISEANAILVDEENPSMGYVNIRVGFHSGPVVTDVIGTLNPRYGLFGDTVNTASRMESNSKGNRILCSKKSYEILRRQAPEIPVKKRGKIFVKGKGDMETYWVGAGVHKKHKGIEKLPPTPIGKRVDFIEFDDPVPSTTVKFVGVEQAPEDNSTGNNLFENIAALVSNTNSDNTAHSQIVETVNNEHENIGALASNTNSYNTAQSQDIETVKQENIAALVSNTNSYHTAQSQDIKTANQVEGVEEKINIGSSF